MSFRVKTSSAKSGDLAPAGTHPAVLVGLIDLGTQDHEYQGSRHTSHDVYLVWELTNEDGRPLIARDFNLSLNPKSTLRNYIERWRGKAFADGEEFDPMVLLGKACLLSIVHKEAGSGSTYSKIDGVAAVTKGMKVEKPKITPVAWEVNGQEIPPQDWLPYLYGQAVADVVKRSYEWRGSPVPPREKKSNGKQQPVVASAAANQDADDGTDEMRF